MHKSSCGDNHTFKIDLNLNADAFIIPFYTCTQTGTQFKVTR